MEPDVLIKVENLSKKFTRSLKRSMLYGSMDMLRSMAGQELKTNKLRKGEFWALEDVNFELRKGEALGILGINGSGKSTLLRILTGIYPPDAGKVSIRGKVGSLIAVGAGFNPNMTGFENIYLNGVILGMTKKEIDAKLQSIIDFADIGDFLQAPISTYSSGMRVRLGFAIAIHCEPDILLIDEILSVGDLTFRNKSMRHMAEYRKKANALIFVSHDLEQTRTLCNQVMILNKGQVVFLGDTQEGIVRYEEIAREIRVDSMQHGLKLKAAIKSGDIDVVGIKVLNSKGEATTEIELNEAFQVQYEFNLHTFQEDLYFSVAILNEDLRNCIWVLSNDDKKVLFTENKPGNYTMTVKFAENKLAPGVYIPNIAIRNGETGELFEKILPDLTFRVKSDGRKLERGFVNVETSWDLKKIS